MEFCLYPSKPHHSSPRFPNQVRSLLLLFSILGLNGAPPQDPKSILAEADRLAWLKNWTRAKPLFEEAEQGFTARGDRRNALYCHVGKLRGELRSTSPLVISHQIASLLDDPIVKSDKTLRLRCLTVKGDADLDTNGSFAQRDWTEALSIAKELGLADWESRANGELGILAFLNGDSSGAIVQVGLALRRAVTAHDLGAEIRYRTIAASGMTELGQMDAALSQFDKAIALATNNKDLGMPLLALTGKAGALVKMNRQAEARTLLNQALATTRLDGNAGYQAELLTQLGALESKAGERKKAVAYLEEASNLASSTSGQRLVALANYELAKLYAAAGDTPNQSRVLRSGISASRRAGDRYFLPRYLAQYADFEASQHRTAHAEALFGEATDIVNGMLMHVSGPNAESDLVAAMSEIYEAHFRLEASRGRADAALAVLEQARGRATADLLKSPQPTSRQSADLTAQEQVLSELQLQLWKQQSRQERKKLLEKIVDAEQDIGPLQAADRQRFSRPLVSSTSIALIRARLRTDEVLVEYFIHPFGSYAIVLTKDSIVLRNLKESRELNAALKGHLEAIANRRSIASTGSSLYALLIEPIRRDIEARKNLIISPDGQLNQLPFDTLVDPGGKLLLEDKVISYTPSANVLALLREAPKRPKPELPLLAVSSSPVESPILGLTMAASIASNAAERGTFDTGEASFRPLPAANDEVRSVAQLFGKKSVLLMNATETQFKAEDLQQFRVIHLAMHGFISAKNPQRSALVFRPDSNAKEDGFLQAREITRLPLRADLVTLSACDTGSGKLKGEEGVESLARPFLFAGARSVLANLWDVDDEFSRALMKRFYVNIAGGQQNATALNGAKLAMLHDYGDHALAALWSGFVLVGDGAVRVFPTKERVGD